MQGKKKGFILTLTLLVALCCLLVAGCGTKEGTGSKAATHTVTDLAGRDVTVKEDVERIAVVPIPWASIVYSVDDSGKRIVGMHPSAMRSYKTSMLRKLAPEMADADTSFVGNDFKVNAEETAKLRPDAVILWDYQKDDAAKLEALGIPTLLIHYGSLEDVQKGIHMLGQLLNQEEQADRLIQYHKDVENYFEGKASALAGREKPKVLYLQQDKHLSVAGGQSVNQIMIEMTGGTNAASEVEADDWKRVTMEQVAAWNPDIIICSNFSDIVPDDLLGNRIEGQDWSQIKAVRDGRVYKAPQGIYRWDAPCVESPLMLKWLGKVIQPEVFTDYDVAADIKAFYKDMFHWDLADDDLADILHRSLNPSLKI